MSTHRKTLILSIVASGFFLFLDQALKYIAYTHQEFRAYLLQPWLGWEFLGNTGIAFSLPLPTHIVIIATPIILLLLLLYYSKQKKKTVFFTCGTMLIIAGAVSNFVDRFLFEMTIDYIRILTSVINIADVLILTGATLLILDSRKIKRRTFDKTSGG